MDCVLSERTILQTRNGSDEGRPLFTWLEDLEALTQALVNGDPIPPMHDENDDEQKPQLRVIRGGLSDAS